MLDFNLYSIYGGSLMCLSCTTLLFLVLGIVIDGVFGDPLWFPHPVIYIGKLIATLEKVLRYIFGCPYELQRDDIKKRELIAGAFLWFMVVPLVYLITNFIIYLAFKINLYLGFVLSVFLSYQIFAQKSLYKAAMDVFNSLKKDEEAGRDNPIEGRKSVAMIVGRDVDALDYEGVIKATIETIAENTVDGITAPLFFMAIGGIPLAMAYKAVNTLDSMVGYKNSRYLYFGRISAKLDDFFNFIPARITGFLMALMSYFISEFDGNRAIKIFFRDRLKHASPNSAHCEAAMAGGLGVQLAGDANYFGELYKKEYIGDAIRDIEKKDIYRACRLMIITSFAFLVVLGIVILGIGIIH